MSGNKFGQLLARYLIYLARENRAAADHITVYCFCSCLIVQRQALNSPKCHLNNEIRNSLDDEDSKQIAEAKHKRHSVKNMQQTCAEQNAPQQDSRSTFKLYIPSLRLFGIAIFTWTDIIYQAAKSNIFI